ncbi:MAG: 4Fe-4S binding protein [Candidatus Cloacimonetes bacterium]|nr:4Fe-4S binding protein [Candidatus Cloacimonadota bacterium]MCF7814086.1 4Fe-4S binding protein [Candidatus Cloacimonadota bacterium]MCF7867985.1 4Fe-4S binding protein [Candidatus Cloacimonadota bacterium]MCF7883443.1 4Fe-4S binding protein [Candidatus Cloacimonadota bacterium]
MKNRFVILTFLMLMFVLSLNIFSQAETQELAEFSGTIKNIGGDWYLNTGEDFFMLKLAPEEFLTENEITLEKNADIIVSGILTEYDEINAYKIVYNEVTLELLDAEGKALWEDATANEFYVVNQKNCIGCRLCVSNCPTNAISMVKGKAVIDAEKCIACGICANGDGNKFQGCPTNTISISE